MQFLHCSRTPLFSEQWRWRYTLFSEQCIMVEFLESSIFMFFVFLRSARDLAVEPCTVNSFFFLLIKCLLPVFLKKHSSQTGSKKSKPCMSWIDQPPPPLTTICFKINFLLYLNPIHLKAIFFQMMFLF